MVFIAVNSLVIQAWPRNHDLITLGNGRFYFQLQANQFTIVGKKSEPSEAGGCSKNSRNPFWSRNLLALYYDPVFFLGVCSS
jgi:hypothetical protein